ncbi:MAG: hypothetical protein QMB70_11135, partial [Aeromonadaceae bacterium]
MDARMGCWLLLTLASGASADTLWLTNGDRLTGQITKLQDGKLGLNTKYAGTLQIKWPEVQRIESQAPLLIELAPGQKPPPKGG